MANTEFLGISIYLDHREPVISSRVWCAVVVNLNGPTFSFLFFLFFLFSLFSFENRVLIQSFAWYPRQQLTSVQLSLVSSGLGARTVLNHR